MLCPFNLKKIIDHSEGIYSWLIEDLGILLQQNH